MTLATANILNYHGNDADHRTFAQGVHNLLIAAGLTQTSDTGQANLATITRPSVNAVSGYEMFRFNDAEQATLPIFIKVEYGTSSPSQNLPGLRVSVGQATSGAGVLTVGAMTHGVSQVWASRSSSEAVTTQTRPAWCSYGNGHMVLVVGHDPAVGRALVFIVERPKLYDGSKSTSGIIFWGLGNTITVLQYLWEIERAGGGGPTPLVNPSVTNLPWAIQMDAQDDVVGADVSLLPMPVLVNTNLYYSACLLYRATALPADSVDNVSVFGTSRSYRAMGNVSFDFFTNSGVTEAAVAFPNY